MTTLQKLLKIIAEAQLEEISLSTIETREVITAFKEITNESQTIDKALKLAKIIRNDKITLSQLSNRENEIFKLIGLGLSSRKIGDLLSISESTVGTHRKKIIKKLNISGPGQLQKVAVETIQKTKQ
jgi:two-component system nitrate/nitrite response regulator NarL